MPLGEVSIDHLAGELGVSRRTLQRRLTDRKTYFLQVLAEVRAELESELTGCEDIGLYVGRTLFFSGINLQLYMSTLCASFREYLNLVPSILKLRGDIGETRVERSGDFILVVWDPLQEASKSERYLSDEILYTSSAIVNMLCVDPIPVRRADFTYARPKDLTQLELAFGRELHFEQARSCIYLDRASLDSPIIKIDYELDEEV